MDRGVQSSSGSDEKTARARIEGPGRYWMDEILHGKSPMVVFTVKLIK